MKEVRIVVLDDAAAPEFDGWHVAQGSLCQKHELAVIVLISPAQAALIATEQASKDPTVVACVVARVQTALAHLFPGVYVHHERLGPRDS